jgi:hypothetical protein
MYITQNNIKMLHYHIGSEDVHWIIIAHDGVQWEAVVNKVMNFTVLWETGILSTKRLSSSHGRLDSMKLLTHVFKKESRTAMVQFFKP